MTMSGSGNEYFMTPSESGIHTIADTRAAKFGLESFSSIVYHH